MNKKNTVLIGATVFVLGGLSMGFSYSPRPYGSAGAHPAQKRVAAPAKAVLPASGNEVPAVSAFPAPAPAEGMAGAQGGDVALMVPPGHLPKAPSQAMTTSLAPVAPAHTVSASQKVARAPKAQSAVAAAKKPKKLFSYVRLLNYSPHPTEEEFLKDKPLSLNGKNYHIGVAYKEGWNVINDDLGDLKKLGFEINIFENGVKVRNLRIPDSQISAKSLSKGKVLGLAEVAPYKFRIAIDDFAVKNGMVTEVVFKFDMVG